MTSNKEHQSTLNDLTIIQSEGKMPTKDQLVDIILSVAMSHHEDISYQDENNAVEAAEKIQALYGCKESHDQP